MINIAGLGVGLSTCLLITLYILHESAYDQHHSAGDRVYRVVYETNDKGDTWAALSAPIAWAAKESIPEIEQPVRLLTFPEISKMLVKYQQGNIDKQFNETNGYYVDSTFFDLFSYQFKYGRAATALRAPASIALSTTMSEKFFGDIDPIGKVLVLNAPYGEKNYTVTAVFKNNQPSHIPANYFLSMRNDDMWHWVSANDNWFTNNIFFTYLKLRPDADPKKVLHKIQSLYEEHAGIETRQNGTSKTFTLQAMPEIYLHSNVGNEIAANGNITYLYILGSIAAFILLIACINFMNLSSAHAEKRAREVGVRKVMGAGKSGLVKQFLGESLVLSIFALLLASLIIWLALPLFNALTDKQIHPADHPSLLLWMLVITLITGLISGTYPAFYLSSFRPVVVLKGKLSNNFNAATIRKGLVVFQFVISICLVVGAVVIFQQLRHLKQQQLGFNPSQQLVVPLYNNGSPERYEVLENELKKIPQVSQITAGSTYPGVPNINDMLFYAEGKPKTEVVDVTMATIESGYFETLGIKLLHGRGFSKAFPGDSASIVLNESALKEFGYAADNAVGRSVQFDFNGTHNAFRIVGVVQDFNFESLHRKIKPYGFATGFFSNRYNFLILNLATADYNKAVAAVAAVWKKQTAGAPFEYSFIDQDFQRNYQKEERSSRMVAYFTAIAIFIACLGLYGLAVFSAAQRSKEVGIRKVLGASVASVAGLLSADFVKLVAIAILIATPLSWLLMNHWLQDFEYRITISAWVFVAAAAAVMLLALLTTGFLALKAGLANPVDALRNE